MKRIGYIDGRRLFLADGQALSFGTDKDIEASFNASLSALEFSAAIFLPTDKKLLLRDAGVYIHSHTDGRIRIDADGTAQGSILLNCGVGGTITMGNIIGLFCTTAKGTANGMLWYDNTTHKMQYRSQDQNRTVVNTAEIQTFTENLTIDGEKKLFFRDSGVYLYSHVDGRFAIYVDGNDQAAILLSPAAGGGIRMGGFLCLHHTPGVDGAYNGQMWYDSVAGTFKCRQADLVKTFTTS